ncbi:MAG: cellulase family glycosylhydrolase [Spirochaetales bacterium]|nr:cellulase family glycosylhydrolase [Spirochaetales bacterium]
MKKAGILKVIILVVYISGVIISIQTGFADDWLQTKGNRVYDNNGNIVWITGINWFGYETDTFVFHGLWTRDLESVLHQVADLGFNAIRIPMSVYFVLESKKGSVYSNSVTIEYNPNPGASKNTYLDGMDTLEILDYAIDYCGRIGLKVILDMHSLSPDGYQHNLWYNEQYNFNHFREAWRYLAGHYRYNDTVIGFDIKNEPHGKLNEEGFRAAKWDSSLDPNNWKSAVELVANEIHSINPRVLILIEGVEEYRDSAIPNIREKLGLPYDSTTDLSIHTTWWGGNLMGVRVHPISLFQPSRFVYSPHEYGPNVHIQPWFEYDFNRSDLEIVWRHYWFFIHENGTAPIHIGEWGGNIAGSENADNLIWMTAFRDFIAENNLNHTFWCLNQDSGDTGGILAGSAWEQVDENKYNFIKPTLWQDVSGRFVSLDHEVPLGSKGITLTDYYSNPANPTFPPGPSPSPTGPGLPRKGDVNSDDSVDIVDALIIARYCVKLPVPIFNDYAADVNDDGLINIIDALIVTRISVNINQYPIRY